MHSEHFHIIHVYGIQKNEPIFAYTALAFICSISSFFHFRWLCDQLVLFFSSFGTDNRKLIERELFDLTHVRLETK
jgi:hypothetical protein